MLRQRLRTLLNWARFTRLLARGVTRNNAADTIFVSVSGGGTGSAADLRGHAIARALPNAGIHAVVLPAGLNAWQRKALRKSYAPRAVLLQQTRNRWNTPDLYPGIPCILDVDDADIIDPQAQARIGTIASRCHGVVAGSRFLASLFRQHNPNTQVIWTGTYLTGVPGAQPNNERARIVAWAPSDPFGYPDEADFVLETVRQLADIPAFTFRIYGIAPEKREQAKQRFGSDLPTNVTLELTPPLPYERFIASLAEVAIGLQPVCESNPYSMGKSFGKVLAYLAADVAVIASNNIDHPLFFEHERNGLLPVDQPADWAAACAGLLADPEKRHALASEARADFLARLTTEKAAHLLSRVMHQAIKNTHRHA